VETKSLIGTLNKKGQKYVDPNYLFFEAPREASFMTGSEVIKEAIRRAPVRAGPVIASIMKRRPA